MYNFLLVQIQSNFRITPLASLNTEVDKKDHETLGFFCVSTHVFNNAHICFCLLLYLAHICFSLLLYLAHFSFLTNIGGFKNICTKLLKGINSLYQHIDFFSLTMHIIKHIKNR